MHFQHFSHCNNTQSVWWHRQLRNTAVTKVSQCRGGHDGFKRYVFRAEVQFSAAVKQNGGKCTQPLASAHECPSSFAVSSFIQIKKVVHTVTFKVRFTPCLYAINIVLWTRCWRIQSVSSRIIDIVTSLLMMVTWYHSAVRNPKKISSSIWYQYAHTPYWQRGGTTCWHTAVNHGAGQLQGYKVTSDTLLPHSHLFQLNQISKN